MKHAADVVILIDPAQEWEESQVILGVYGSFAAASAATPRLRQLTYADGGRYDPAYGDGWRNTQAMRWVGDMLVESWTFTTASGWKRD